MFTSRLRNLIIGRGRKGGKKKREGGVGERGREEKEKGGWGREEENDYIPPPLFAFRHFKIAFCCLKSHFGTGPLVRVSS